MKKRLISLLLVVMMIVTLCPMSVLADDEAAPEDNGEETVVVTQAPEPEPEPEPEPAEGEPAEEPSEEPAGEEPSEEPAGEEPSEEPAGEEPSEEPAGEEPSEEPEGEDPVNGDDPAEGDDPENGEDPTEGEDPAEEPEGEDPAEEPEEPEPEEPAEEVEAEEKPEEEIGLFPAGKDSATSHGVTVKAVWDEGVFPEGTTLSIDVLGTEKAFAMARGALGKDVKAVDGEAVDITFVTVEGETVQPAEGKEVRISIHLKRELSGEMFFVLHEKESKRGQNEINAASSNIEKITATADADSASFDGRSFSVYAIVGGDPVLLTVQFYESETATEPFAQQIIKNGEQITMPDISGLEDLGTFQGFYTESGTKFTDFNTAYTVSETGTLRLNARFGNEIRIIYHNEDSSVITMEAWEEGYQINVTHPFVYKSPAYSCVGWNTKQDGSGTTYVTGNELTGLTEDLDLWPVFAIGRNVAFDSQGGTAIQSRFILIDGTVTKPDDPTRSGYTFAGWEYDGASFRFADDANPFVITEDLPEEGITLTAQWELATAEYTVVVWLEKPEYSSEADKYTYGTYFIKSGVTGSDVSFTSEDNACDEVRDVTYTHTTTRFAKYFLENGPTAESVAAVNASGGIAADGSTVLNVYYRSFVWNVKITGFGYNYSFPCRMAEPFLHAAQRANVELDINGLRQYACRWVVQNWSENDEDDVIYDPMGNLKAPWTLEQFFNVSSPHTVYNDGATLTLQLRRRATSGYRMLRQDYGETVESSRTSDGYQLTYVENGDEAYPYRISDNYELMNYIAFYYPQYRTGHRTDTFKGFEFYMKRMNDYVAPAGTAYDDSYKTSTLINRLGTTYYTNNVEWMNAFPRVSRSYLRRLKYTVSFDTNGGPSVADITGVPYEDTLDYYADRIGYQDGDDFVLYVVNSTVKHDDLGCPWVFKGWYDNGALVGDPVVLSETVMPNENIRLFAKWEVQDISVTYDANGGTLAAGQEETVEIPFGTVPEKPADPTPPTEDDSFIGWTLDGAFYDFSQQLYEDTTLVAVYKSTKTYSVTYDAGDGSGTVPTDTNTYLPNAEAIVLGKGGVVPPTGQFFAGWMDEDGNVRQPGEMIVITKDTTLTAVYSETVVTYLIYDVNGGEGTLTDIDGSVLNALTAPTYGTNRIDNIERNASLTLSSGAGISRENYEFIGWNTNKTAADAGTVEFAPGATCAVDELDNRAASGDLNTLYAVWRSTTTGLTIKKNWNGDADSTHEDTLTVHLIKTVGETQTIAGTYTLKESEDWELTVDVPLEEDGTPIVYSWTEDAPAGWLLTGNETVDNVTTLTNTPTESFDPRTFYTGTKTWEGDTNDTRPASLTVTLKWCYTDADGNEHTGVVEQVSGESTPSLGTGSGTPYPPAWDDTDTDVWTYTFGNLPIFAPCGAVIYYEAEEEVPDLYELTEKTVTETKYELGSAEIHNVTHGSNFSFDIVDDEHLTFIHVMKGNHNTIWTPRPAMPEERQLLIQALGLTGKSVEFVDGPDCSYYPSGSGFSSLPTKFGVYAGKAHVQFGAPNDWSQFNYGMVPRTSYTAGSTAFTNKYETVSVSVKKVWQDANDQDGYRPETLTVQLKNGDEVVETVELNEDNGWTVTVSVPKYAVVNGVQTEIEYEWAETVPDHYEEVTPHTVDGSTTTITNKHEPEKTSITVTKVWNDANNQDGIRPDEVTFTVTGSDSNTYEVTLEAAAGDTGDTWTATIEVEKYWNHGTEVTFTVDENAIADYKKTIDNENLKITNKHEPEMTSITVIKAWKDDADAQKKRSGVTATIHLQKTVDGVTEEIETVEVGKENNWKQTWDLPVYEDGKEITYSVKEVLDVPNGYTSDTTEWKNVANGGSITITNAYKAPDPTPGTGDNTNIKLWLAMTLTSVAGLGGMMWLAFRKKKREQN